MVAAVAADEPDTAAKMPQPRMLTCMSRPGSRVIQGARPVNMSSDRRERNRISPIQMNMGSAASSQELLEPQTVVDMIGPTGAEVNPPMAIRATPNKDSATQTPLPRKANSAMTSTSVRTTKSITTSRFQ